MYSSQCSERRSFFSLLNRKERSMESKVIDACSANWKNTIALIDQVARAKGIAVSLEKV